MAFKIQPVYDELRGRDRIILESHEEVIPNDEVQTEVMQYGTYQPYFFQFNNTVKSFPKFSYNNTTPDISESEFFCLHLEYNLNKREKTYGQNF